jgi:hypothetical protein
MGASIATVAGDGIMHFDLSSAPTTLYAGDNSIRILADINGNIGTNIQFIVQNGFDFYTVDADTNAGVTVLLGTISPTQITIQ